MRLPRAGDCVKQRATGVVWGNRFCIRTEGGAAETSCCCCWDEPRRLIPPDGDLSYLSGGHPSDDMNAGWNGGKVGEGYEGSADS